MADQIAKRDQNSVPTLLAVSSADGTSILRLYANPDTHRLLVDLGDGVTGPGLSTDKAIARWEGTTGEVIQDYSSNAPTIGDTGAVIFRNGLDVTGNTDSDTFSAGGTAAVADGTYTVGSRITPVTGTLGTITVKGGIITAIQQAT